MPSRVDSKRSSSGSAIPLFLALLGMAAGVESKDDSGGVSHPIQARRHLRPTDPEVILGDRLFFETRFSQFFASTMQGDVNVLSPSEGDPVVSEVPRPGRESLPGPFRGQGISCRHCHLGDDLLRIDQFSQRTYCDFSARTAVPSRGDGISRTVRNTPQMVGLGLAREVPSLFHFDGEFASAEDLAIDTLVGRNMGWQFHERALASRHIARVIREDDGTVNVRHARGENGRGLPYRIAMGGSGGGLPSAMIVPAEYRLDVSTASDDEILLAIAKLIHAYMDSLRFGSKDTYRKTESPYDLFLSKNDMPAAPDPGESSMAYGRRLLAIISSRQQLEWVSGHFTLHQQAYVFAREELEGMKIFLSQAEDSRGVRGSCINCHPPPQFTDHKFHNTGISQLEYDALFGDGSFAALSIPSLSERNMHPEAYLPVSVMHPNASDRFRSAPSKAKPGFADLGVWNVLANPAFPRPQAALRRILCPSPRESCETAGLLARSVARFKTPSLRNLGHSQPYFHSGAADSLEEVLATYSKAADLARSGKLRNGDSEMKLIHLDADARAKVASFLRALNEDYH